MGLDDVKQFMHDGQKEQLIEKLIRTGVIGADDAATLRDAVQAWRDGELTYAAITRWLNSKDGVDVSMNAVRNWMLSQ